MNVSPEVLVSSLGAVLSIGIAWGISSRKQDDQNEKNVAFRTELDKLWKYKDDHTVEANERRIEIMEKLGEMNAKFALRDGQFEEILRRLERMERKMHGGDA